MNDLISNRKTINRIFSPEQALIMLFLFLGAMNYLSRYYYWFFIAFLLFCFFVSRIRLGSSLFALLGLSLSILLFGELYGSLLTSVLRPFVYPVCYLLGQGFLGKFNNDAEKKRNESAFPIVAIILAVGLFIHLVLNLSINIGSEERNTPDFWTGEIMSATGQATLACLPIAVICAIFFSEHKVWQKILAMCALTVILYYNLILAGRTMILLMFLCSLLALIYAFLGNRANKSLFKARLAIGVAVVILTVIVLYTNNFLNIQQTIVRSNLYQRFFGRWGMDVDDDGRADYKLVYIQNMWGYFWGGGNIHKIAGGYAHDIFLDTYDEAGIFALLSMLVYIALSLKNFWRCITNKSLDFKVRQFVLCIYVLCYLQFMVEPILQAMQWLFAIFCFLDGMLRSYLDDNKKMLKRKMCVGHQRCVSLK